MQRLSCSAALAALIVVGSTCDTPQGKAQLTIEVSPLALDGITDATYRLSVQAGATLVWQAEVSSARYGDGRGGLAYVGTCDASSSPNTVTLELLSLADGGGPLDADEWVAPPPVTVSAECVEDADTPVVFDLTIARPARQGFFDIGVMFDDIFCSAKLDCGVSRAIADDMLLLHDPRNGERGTTAVLAFACSAGPDDDVDTRLYLDDLRIACDDGDTIVAVDIPGNVDFSLPPSANPTGYLFGAAVYRGVEAIANKAFWNVALGLDRARFAAAGRCTLYGRATASDGLLEADASGFVTPAGIYPVITWDLALSDGDGRLCTTHPIDAPPPDDGVGTAYPPSPLDPPLDHGWDPDGPNPTAIGMDFDPDVTQAYDDELIAVDLTFVRQGAVIAAPDDATPILFTSSAPGCVAAPAPLPITAGLTAHALDLPLAGVAPCTATITATHPRFGSAETVAAYRAVPRLVLSPDPVEVRTNRTGQVQVGLMTGVSGTVIPDTSSAAVVIGDPTCITDIDSVTLVEGAAFATLVIDPIIPLAATCTTTVSVSHPRYGSDTTTVVVVPPDYELRSDPTTLSMWPGDERDIEVFLGQRGSVVRVPTPADTGALKISNDNPDCVAVPPTLAMPAGVTTHRMPVVSVGFEPCTAQLTFLHDDYPAHGGEGWGGDGATVNIHDNDLTFSRESAQALHTDVIDVDLLLEHAPPPNAGDIALASSDPSCAAVPDAIPFEPGETQYPLEIVGPGFACQAQITASSVFGSDTFLVTFGSIPVIAWSPAVHEINVGRARSATLVITSDGVPITFPSGAGSVALTSADPTCASVPATRGLSVFAWETRVSIAGGSTPCTTEITATHPLYGSTTLAVAVVPLPDLGPLTISVEGSEGKIGSGLMARWLLQRTNNGNGLPAIDVVVSSGDPNVFISRSASLPGSSSLVVTMGGLDDEVTLYVQTGTGHIGSTGTLSAFHARYDEALVDTTIVPPAFAITNLALNKSTAVAAQLPDDELQALIGVALADGSLSRQYVSPVSGAMAVTFTSSDPTMGLMRKTGELVQSVTIDVAPTRTATPSTLGAGGVALNFPTPLRTGSFRVSAASAESHPYAPASVDVVMTATTSTLAVADLDVHSGGRVGAALQDIYRLTLTGSHPAMTVRIASADPSIALVASGPTLGGAPYIDLTVGNNVTNANFYVQGVAGASGVATISASAANFIDGEMNVTVMPAIVRVLDDTLVTSRTGGVYQDFTDDTFNIEVGLKSASGSNVFHPQTVAPTFAPLPVTVTKSASGVATLVRGATSGDSVVTYIQSNEYHVDNSVAVDSVYPAFDSTFTVTLSADGFANDPQSTKTVVYNMSELTATLTESAITSQRSGLRVGAGLAMGLVYSPTYNPTGTDYYTVTSSNPALAVVSTSATGTGLATLEMSAPEQPEFYVHGITGQTGTVQITVSCTYAHLCFAPAVTQTVTVVPLVALLTNVPTTLTTSTIQAFPDDYLQVGVAVASVANGNVRQVVSGTAGNLPLTVSITGQTAAGIEVVNSSGVASATSVIENLAPGQTQSNFASSAPSVVYLRVGPNAPTGVRTVYANLSAPGSATVTQTINYNKTQATLQIDTSINGTQVGAGLEVVATVRINNVAAHPGLSVTLTSGDGALGLVGDTLGGQGATAHTFTFSANATQRQLYVHALPGVTGTFTVTATATGATDGTATYTSQTPTVQLWQGNSYGSSNLVGTTYSRIATGSNQNFWVRVGILRSGSFVPQNVAGSGWYYVRVSNPSSPAVVGVGPASAAATGSEVTLYVMSGGYNSDFFALDPLGPAGNQGTNVIRFHGRHTSVPDWPTTPWQTLSYTTT